MNYNIGILGSSGFLGTDVVKYFISRKKKIFTYNRLKNKKKYYSKYVQSYFGNFKDKNFEFFLKKINIIIFCISEISNKKKMHDVNVKFLKEIITKIKEKKITKFIYLSSVGVYKNKQKDCIIKETCNDFSDSIYAQTKLKAENIVIKNSLLSSYIPVILRSTTIVGKEMPNKSIAQLMHFIRKGSFFYFDNQESFLNYSFVRDLSKIIYFFATVKKKPKYIIYNVSNYLKLKDFVKFVQKYFKLNNKFYINVPFIFVRILSLIGIFFSKFPLTSNRISALSTKHRYCSRRLSESLNLKKLSNIEKGLIEIASTLKKC